MVIAGIILLEFMFVEFEKPGRAMFMFFATLFGLWAFTDFNPFAAMIESPWLALTFIAGYAVIGSVWSIIKFRFYISNKKEEFRNMKEGWLDNQGINGEIVPPTREADWRKYIGTRGWNLIEIQTKRGMVKIPERFRLRKHKGRLMTWVGFWPVSFIWTMINDPIRKMSREIYRKLSGIYQRIIISATSGIVEELSEPVSPVASTTTTEEK